MIRERGGEVTSIILEKLCTGKGAFVAALPHVSRKFEGRYHPQAIAKGEFKAARALNIQTQCVFVPPRHTYQTGSATF